MSNEKRLIFRNIIGDAQATINAIQKYIAENSLTKTVNDVECEIEKLLLNLLTKLLTLFLAKKHLLKFKELLIDYSLI